MSTNLGHKSSGTEVFDLEAILNPSHDGECTSESRHKTHISFCFSWLEDLIGGATEVWENCFFFLSRNVHSPEFWPDTFGYMRRRIRQPEDRDRREASRTNGCQ